MDREQDVLSSAQVRALRRLADSRHTPPYLARRAEVVLDENRARSTGSARSAGVSRQTSAKWFRRYLESGADGLKDAPRQGRPPASRDTTGHESTAEALMAAPLFADSLRWTSRSIAAANNCTQSAVARVWRRTFDEGRVPLGEALPSRGLELEACFSTHGCSVLLLRHHPGSTPTRRTDTAFMRSALRPALQTLLAVDLLSNRATSRVSSERAAADGPESPASGLVPFLADCRAEWGDSPPGFALCTSQAAAGLLRRSVPAVTVILVDRDRWQGLLLDLGPRLSSRSSEALTAAQQRAMVWALKQWGPFAWVRSPGAPRAGSEHRRASRSQTPLATSEQTADSILASLERDLMAGRLHGGDRITETYLTRSAHASRGHVRDALRVLASRGIVELQPNRGAVVPRPGVDDVIETYAARRALGALIVRRAAESPLPGHLPILEQALQNMLETAKSGDALATGEDDFRFQEAMGEMTGMRRVPTMFSGLTSQLRMFVAVLGLRYGYSIPAMCADNSELLRLIADHNGAEAVSRWNSKMNNAANYMIQQLKAASV